MNRALICIFLVVAAALASATADASRRTVCTITVNSPDEKQAFRRYLPESQYDFVELVERGRPDWLESACRKGVRCDVLIVSGHFNGVHFLSDQITVQENLPVQEMERASCSNACPALFSQLKEVYLFGCNTLNRESLVAVTPDMVRSLVRSGHSESEARRMAQELVSRYAESNRDIMRRVFRNVPVIYGFYDTAPLGPTAAPIIGRYLQNASPRDIGNGRPSEKLLRYLGPNHLTAAQGMMRGDAREDHRAEVCRLVDDHLPASQKLEFVHAMLEREMAEVRLGFDRIESAVAALTPAQRSEPEVAQVLSAIGTDTGARKRYLEFARDADEPSLRARMLATARDIGWVDAAQYRTELAAMVHDLLAQPAMSSSDVDLVCTLPDPDGLFAALADGGSPVGAGERADRSAALACLGSREHRARMLALLTSGEERDVQMAQVYFNRRSIGGAEDVRTVSTGIAHMNAPAAQVRALETLARQDVRDRDALATLTRLFAQTPSVHVQRAIAGVLIRADYRSVATPDTVAMLRQHRHKSPDGEDMVDVLLRRMQMH